MDQSSKDIFNLSVIEDFYRTRPNDTEDVSLYKFDIIGKERIQTSIKVSS